MSIHTYNKSKTGRYQHRPGYGARRPVTTLRHPVLVCVVRDGKLSHNAHFLTLVLGGLVPLGVLCSNDIHRLVVFQPRAHTLTSCIKTFSYFRL